MSFNGIHRKIGTAIPFNKIFTILNIHEFIKITQRLKRLEIEIRTDIKPPNSPVFRDDIQRMITLRNNLSDSH